MGAGPGSLTRSLLELRAKKVIAIEKDARFLPALEYLKEASDGRLEIVHGDMLKLDEEELLHRFAATPTRWEAADDECQVRLLGNLPFGVATPLLLKWLRQVPDRKGLFAFGRVPLVLMFQKEVAQRIVARPSDTRVYGRLSVMTSYAMKARDCFTVSGKAFVPPPKVDAGVVHFQPLLNVARPPIPSYLLLETVLRIVFQQRRKQLVNALAPLQADVSVLLHSAGLSPHLRPENLSVDQWCHLTQAYHQMIPFLDPLPPFLADPSRLLDADEGEDEVDQLDSPKWS